MSVLSLASFVRAALALSVPGLLFAACGGSVVVEDPPPECEAPLALCDGECVNLNVDILHCGSCDAACFEGTCNDGSCEAFQTCPPGLINCFGTCVDPSSDPANCGGCGIACESGSCSLGSCDIGECFCGGVCDVISLGSGVPQSASAGPPGLSEQWVPSCVSGSGQDAVFSFFAPADDQYVFDTAGSPPGTVLEVIDPSCGSFGCAGPGPGGGAASVTVSLAAGEHVLVVVDTQGQPGAAEVHIDTASGSCMGCGEYITTGDPGPGLCPGSQELYDTLIGCICAGKCSMACVAPCSGMGGELPPECQDCIFDPVQGCGNEFDDCSNDL